MPMIPKVRAAAPAATGAVEPIDAPDQNTEPLITDPYTMKLSTPLKSHQGTLHELKLTMPTAADYIEIGKVPFDVRGDDDNRRVTVDFKCLGQWASRLTGHDEIIVGQLAAKDWLGLSARINQILMQASAD